MNKSIKLIFFVLGIAVVVAGFLLLKKITAAPKENTRNDFYIITNQIKKMNKMVVMEQDFSSLQKTKISSEILGGIIPNSEKEIMTFTKTNAQVSYDLNKMRIDVDSVNRKLYIRELPRADIKITPSVEIQSMDDSFFNRFNENDLHKITNSAKENALKTVNQDRLRQEGRQQLISNLSQIFVLAKALHYEIIDETKEIDTTKL